MNRRHFSALTLVLGAALAIEGTVAAQKGKTPPDVPGSFTMRSAYDPGGAGPDRVSGDGMNQDIYALDSDGTRVTLNPNREFRADLFVDRYVQLDFLEGPSPCGGAGCFRTWNRFVIPQPNTFGNQGPWRVIMQTNAVTGGNVETANGLMGLTAGGAVGYARFFISFKDPAGRDFHWSALFNPAEYPGSSLVRVARTDACSWTIYADSSSAIAGLLAWSVLKGRNGNSDEGLFSMPFGINFTAPGCGA